MLYGVNVKKTGPIMLIFKIYSYFYYSEFAWASWRLKYLVTRLFVQQFVQANIKKHQSAALLNLCEENQRRLMDSPKKGQ